MKLEVMRQLMAAIEKNEIPEPFFKNRSFETSEDVAALEVDFIQLKTGMDNTNNPQKSGVTPEADIDAWAGKGSSQLQENADIEAWAKGK